MAKAAMILGIASIPLMFLAIGLLLAPVAIILGIIALVSINKDPRRFGGKGMAITGIATGAGAFVLLVPVALMIAILLPSLGKARELSQRSTCAANLRGIAQSTIVYSGENSEYYPYLGPAKIVAQPPVGDIPGGLMHDMFYLVGNGQVGAKQFLCKSDPAKTAATLVPMSTGVNSYWKNPSGGDPNLCYSYSFAYQYSKPNQLADYYRNTIDAAVAIAADMNPGDQNTRPIKNSLTHQGDGQNVAFADAHVEFVRMPACGENNDNIYNTGSNDTSTPGTLGQPPFVSSAGNAQGSFDTCLVPGLVDTTSYTRK
jgi:prepilin-type processing-associated H-X9-DG protein